MSAKMSTPQRGPAEREGGGGTLSKTRNASLISSSLSVSFIFLAIMVRNSGKSIVPLPAGRGGQRLEEPVDDPSSKNDIMSS